MQAKLLGRDYFQSPGVSVHFSMRFTLFQKKSETYHQRLDNVAKIYIIYAANLQVVV